MPLPHSSSGLLWTFWNILKHSAYILEHFGTFWNILEYSGTFWNILDVVEGCRKVDFQVDDTHTNAQTHGQTDIH